jgi:hypothetical protein
VPESWSLRKTIEMPPISESSISVQAKIRQPLEECPGRVGIKFKGPYILKLLRPCWPIGEALPVRRLTRTHTTDKVSHGQRRPPDRFLIRRSIQPVATPNVCSIVSIGVEQVVRQWWNGSWGRLVRRDVCVWVDGRRWTVEARSGVAEGRSRRQACGSEREALKIYAKCLDGGGEVLRQRIQAALGHRP